MYVCEACTLSPPRVSNFWHKVMWLFWAARCSGVSPWNHFFLRLFTINFKNLQHPAWNPVYSSNNLFIIPNFEVQNFYLKSSYFNKQTEKLKNEKPEVVMEMDIEGFHSFVKYLIAKGAGGNWGSRQRHWRRYMDVCKGKWRRGYRLTWILAFVF